jgi:chaperonin GroEL
MTDEFQPKIILSSDEMEKKIEEALKEVHDAVGGTMGPSGQLVMYEHHTNNVYPIVTKDGVSVAQMIAFADEAKNNAAQFLIQAARKQVEETGDGTTLTTILAYKLYTEGRKLITAGYDTNDVLSGYEIAAKEIIEELQAQSPQEVGLKELENIARISSNGDMKLAKIIAEAVHRTGKYGKVTQQRNFTEEHEIEYIDGYPLNVGIMEKEFANDGNIMTLKDAYILCTEKALVDGNQLMPLVKKLRAKHENKEAPQLLIISPRISGDVMQVLKKNITQGDKSIFIAHILCSRDLRPTKNKYILEDIASISGGTFVDEHSGYRIDQVTIDMLGRAKTVHSNPEQTVIIGFEKANIENRQKYLEAQIELTQQPITKEICEESIAKVRGCMAIIRVGGQNLSEQSEILFRVDDAIRACQSAREMGYVRGGGVAMILAMREVLKNLRSSKESKSVCEGWNAFMSLLTYPTETILKNAKRKDYESVIEKIKTEGAKGYNIKKKEYKDMLKLGVIDPTKVIVQAIKNALSVAICLLRTNVIIIRDTNTEGRCKNE